MSNPDRALFKIDQRTRELIERAVDPDTGEVSDAAARELDQLAAQEDAVLLDLGAYILNEEAWADAMAEQAKRLQARAAAVRVRTATLRETLGDRLTPARTLRDERVRLRWRKSTAVYIEDETVIPAEYRRVKTIDEPDKTKIRAELAAGNGVEGALLVERKNLVID